jgi:hypothetical protein
MATPRAVEEAPPQETAAKPRSRAARHSGRLLLRMPAGLHEDLARASDRNGVSLNQFITSVLAGAVGWGRDESPPIEATRVRSRWFTILLAANLVLVAAAAVSAITFLVAAWLN